MKELIINKKKYSSRLILGTGKYKDFEETKSAIEASGCEMVTVAIRRMNLGQDKASKNLLDYISPKKYTRKSRSLCFTEKKMKWFQFLFQEKCYQFLKKQIKNWLLLKMEIIVSQTQNLSKQ